MTEHYEACDQPQLNTSPELNVFVSPQEFCVLLKERPELLRCQIVLTLAFVNTCQRKLRVRSTWTLLRQKPYRFRSCLYCLIETTEIAIRKRLPY